MGTTVNVFIFLNLFILSMLGTKRSFCFSSVRCRSSRLKIVSNFRNHPPCLTSTFLIGAQQNDGQRVQSSKPRPRPLLTSDGLYRNVFIRIKTPPVPPTKQGRGQKRVFYFFSLPPFFFLSISVLILLI